MSAGARACVPGGRAWPVTGRSGYLPGVSPRVPVPFTLYCSSKIIHPNGPQYMSGTPASPAPGRDGDPRRVPPWPEWMDDPAYLALQAADEDPGDPDLDPEDAPPPEVEDGELAAAADQIAADQARLAAVAGRLGLTAALAAGTAAAC